MLTRRANRVRGLREAALSLPLLGPLPGDLVKLILRLLPLDTRLRAREVRRGWCALLEDASFWMHVDLSKSCGVNPRFLSNWRLGLALLRAACVRAHGSLQSVDLSGMEDRVEEEEEEEDPVPSVQQWVDAASAADKASLRDLVAPTSRLLEIEQVTALCRALPLCHVRCTVYCDAVEALPLLRREPPFALLTIGHLFVFLNPGGEQAVRDLASALTGHNGMGKFGLLHVPLATCAVALVDAAISAGIKYMFLNSCSLSQTALPALGRLIQSPGFERLSVDQDNDALFEGPALPAFCEALRNCTSLKALILESVTLWNDFAVATQLFDALEGHPSLQELSTDEIFTDGTAAMQQAAGECLARLIARSTSLRKLDVSHNRLDEAGMAPIFDALKGSTGLAELNLSDERFSPEFVRVVVLPAVSANTSLRTFAGLRSVTGELLPELREVHAVLAARRQVDEDASGRPLLLVRPLSFRYVLVAWIPKACGYATAITVGVVQEGCLSGLLAILCR